MATEEVKEVIVKVVKLTDHFEQRGDKVVQSTLQAAQSLNQAAQNAANTSERITAKALDSFRDVAGDVLLQGIREPLRDCDKTLQSSAHKIESATNQLEQKMNQMHNMHAANAWKAFIASAVGSLAIIGVAVYMFMSAKQEIKRTDWISSINSAVANGKLAACTDGGICAIVDKKQIRLDK